MAKVKKVLGGPIKPGDKNSNDIQVLPDGTGTPYLAIFDGSGSPIWDEKNGLPIGMEITNFRYAYKEDDDDCGEFVFETNNVNMICHPKLEYLKPLQLQWGWLYPNGRKPLIGPPRSVVVKKHHGEFTPDGVKITIDFVSASFLLKMSPPKFPTDQPKLLDYLKGVLSGTPVVVQVLTLQTGYTKETKVGRVQSTITPTSPPEEEPDNE